MPFPLNTLVKIDRDNLYAFKGTIDYALSADYAFIVKPGYEPKESGGFRSVPAEYFILDLYEEGEEKGEYPGLLYIRELEIDEETGEALTIRIILFPEVSTPEEAEAIIKEFSDTLEFLSRFTLSENETYSYRG